MRVILADVISLNGKITKGSSPDVHSWSSKEDWEHFVSLRDGCDVIVLDRKTYETVRPQPQEGTLRIVFTSTPERFSGANVPGRLEFTDTLPTDLIDRLVSDGYKKVLIAGGARLAGSFLQAQLIDETYLSFEPVLFGTGRSMLDEDSLDVSLQLESVTRLNDRGTLLAHYSVIKD